MSATADHSLGEVLEGTIVEAAGIDSAGLLLATLDDYLAAQSPFDRQSRLGIALEVLEVTPAIYAGFLRAQVMAWSDEEIAALTAILASIRRRFAGLTLRLPARVHLVKTTGREEGGAACTRRDDVIVLPANKLASILAVSSAGDPLHPARSTAYLEGILIHEFFHLFSKNNPQIRGRLYGLVNYHMLDNEIALPETEWAGGHSMTRLKITNPDAPRLDVRIDLPRPEDPAGGPLSMTPLLIARAPYRGGSFFDYLEWRFLAIGRDRDGRWVPLLDVEGLPQSYPAAALLDAYLALVGRNFAEEIFHPDEILAQSFVLVMQQPDPGLLQAISGAIRSSG